jgi:hypothetical protein
MKKDAYTTLDGMISPAHDIIKGMLVYQGKIKNEKGCLYNIGWNNLSSSRHLYNLSHMEKLTTQFT